jgi:Rrf2 family protein
MSYSLSFSQALYILIYVGNKVELGLYDYIPTQKLSQELNIAPSTAGVILRQLNRAGIIETREGANGGIRLAVQPEDVTVLDVFTAIEQQRPMFQINVHLNVQSEKSKKVQSAVVEVLENAEAAMKTSLRGVSIRALMDVTKG